MHPNVAGWKLGTISGLTPKAGGRWTASTGRPQRGSWGQSRWAGQGCTTKELGQSLYPHPRFGGWGDTASVCHTALQEPEHSCPVLQTPTSGSGLLLRCFCWLLGLPPPAPPPKIVQDVWNANKALLGRSSSALVKYLVWKLFQHLNEQVSHDKKKSYAEDPSAAGGSRARRVSWLWIVCGRQKHVKSWFHSVPRSNPCPLLKPHISEFPPKGGLSICLKEPTWASPPPACCCRPNW